MEDKNPNQNALVQSVTVFFVLLGAIMLFFIYVPVSESNPLTLAFFAAVTSCIFIAKNVYDSATHEAHRHSLQKNLSEHLIFSSKELYTELYQKSPVPYLLIDVNGSIRSANLAALRLLGIKKGSEIGVSVFPYLMTEEPHHIDMVVSKFQNRISVTNEAVQIKREGKAAWALLSLAHFVSNGQHLGLMTLVDITRQKQVETAKSEFVSLASHQLRTPIAGIKWGAELLQMDAKDTLNERQQRYIERLLLGARRMAVLIDDFLRVSRFELGTFHPEYTEVDFKSTIEEVLSELSERIVQKKLTIETKYLGDRQTFRSDANLLRMIATNLISNAVKYTKESGEVHIGVWTTADDITFAVADNGIGVPAAEQERIFEKLFRASNAVRNVPDGTGLGLYIVSEAVEVLHGKASFTSAEGKGSTFEIKLPLERLT
jgi:PAS domain S-box-containing protein